MKNEIRPDNLRVFFERQHGYQKALAKKTGLTPGAISQWKKGIRPVPNEHISAICEVLNVAEEELYKPLFIEHCLADGIKGRLGAVMDKLKESEQADVLRYALTIAEEQEKCKK